MTSSALKTITKTYLMLVLFAAIFISAPLYSFTALILLVLQIYSVYHALRAGLGLALAICTLILTPLVLEPSTGTLFSIFLMLPALSLLDHSLRENASDRFFSPKSGRQATTILKALATLLLLAFVSSLVLLNQTLILTTLILTGYLVFVLGYISYKTPKTPLEESKTFNRVVVGNTIQTPMTLKSKARLPLHVLLETATSWVGAEPSRFMLTMKGNAEINLDITPPTADQSQPQIRALAIDPWGLTQTNQTLKPVDLHTIPRAKYAEWLARKFLEQTAPGTFPAAAIPQQRAVRTSKRGSEYFGSRLYQPSDRLKDIDWKHTFKLQELIVKEFAGAHGQPAIIVANLTAKDLEEADKLAYNLVMSALTLAREAVPTALAAYNNKEILETIPPTNPRETLKKAMMLTRSLTIIKPPETTLHSPEIRRLRRSIGQLEHAKTESAQKLAAILQLEYETIQEVAKVHPACQALLKTAETTLPPALITVVSPWSHDRDALAITLERLREEGYSTVRVELEKHDRRGLERTVSLT